MYEGYMTLCVGVLGKMCIMVSLCTLDCCSMQARLEYDLRVLVVHVHRVRVN